MEAFALPGQLARAACCWYLARVEQRASTQVFHSTLNPECVWWASFALQWCTCCLNVYGSGPLLIHGNDLRGLISQVTLAAACPCNMPSVGGGVRVVG